MSRAAVIELLGNDAVLGDAPYNLSEVSIFPTYVMQGSRRAPLEADGYFLILRWEEMLDTRVGDVQVLTIWAHRSRSAGNNFQALKDLLKRVRVVMEEAAFVTGSDGETMVQANFKGMGPDLADEGYDTFAKYAIFEVNTKVGS
jgi:hypothetical protein